MKAKVGSSVLANSYNAGVEVANESLRGIKNPKIGFLFTSVKYNQEDVMRGIASINSDMKIIGCTSKEAVMTPEGIVTSKDGYAAMLVLEDNELSVGVSFKESGRDARATGRELAENALQDANKKQKPIAMAVFSTFNDEELYIKGIQDVVGDIPVFGGCAADDNLEGKWKVLCQGISLNDGCALALIYSTKDIKNVFTTYKNETDNMGIITKVKNDKTIVEIDNEPALKKYAKWLNVDTKELMGQNIYEKTTLNPLGIKTNQGETVMLRHPIVGYPDNSINVGAKVVEKTAVIELENNVDDLIKDTFDSLKEVNKDFDTSALILIHNSARLSIVKDNIDEEFVAIKNACGDIPFIVPFTFKEYGQVDHSGVLISDLALSFTGFEN